MRLRWITGILLLLLATAFVGGVVWYQPLALGSTTGRDDHLLIDTRSTSSEAGAEIPIYEYEYHAGTSYYTLLSLRNAGPVSVTIVNIDTNVLSVNPYVGPAQLLNGSAKDDPYGTISVEAAKPLVPTVVDPSSELNLWIRWRIGPCDANGSPHYLADSGVVMSSIPLSWTILGFPRTSTIELPYTVAFEVTPESLAEECESAAAAAAVTARDG
jgi:hypothetical protein